MRIIATADLDAPRSEVWAVLTDLDSWSEWNPHAVQASGTLALGSRLDLRLRTGRLDGDDGRTMRFRPRVVELVEGASFAWLGQLGVRGLFDGRHAFALSDLPAGRTRIVQSEDFSGLLVLPLRRTVADAAHAFDAVHVALAGRLDAPARAV